MRPGEGYRELLLAKVLVGEAADLGPNTALTAGRNSALKFPPKRDNSRMRCACGFAACARALSQLKLSARTGTTRSRA